MAEAKRYNYPSKTQRKEQIWRRAEESMRQLAAREEERRLREANRTCAQIGWDATKQAAVRFT